MASENEKLKAQLVALRQQAADAEEARRMAVLAADNAASERDEYRDRAQELQEQLKEVMPAGLVCGKERVSGALGGRVQPSSVSGELAGMGWLGAHPHGTIILCPGDTRSRHMQVSTCSPESLSRAAGQQHLSA
jgi:hypothetical protein